MMSSKKTTSASSMAIQQQQIGNSTRVTRPTSALKKQSGLEASKFGKQTHSSISLRKGTQANSNQNNS